MFFELTAWLLFLVHVHAWTQACGAELVTPAVVLGRPAGDARDGGPRRLRRWVEVADF